MYVEIIQGLVDLTRQRRLLSVIHMAPADQTRQQDCDGSSLRKENPECLVFNVCGEKCP